MNHKHVSARIQHCRSNDPIVSTPCCGAWYHVTTKWLGSPGSTGVCWSKRRNQASWNRHRIKDKKLVGSNRQQHFRPFGCLASPFFYYISSYEHSWDFRFVYCVFDSKSPLLRIWWKSPKQNHGNLGNYVGVVSVISVVEKTCTSNLSHTMSTHVSILNNDHLQKNLILQLFWDDLNFLATLNHPSSNLYNFGILVQVNPAFPTQRVWEMCVMDVTIQSVASKLTEFEGKVAINSNDVCKNMV